jgi:hypothetical protein
MRVKLELRWGGLQVGLPRGKAERVDLDDHSALVREGI